MADSETKPKDVSDVTCSLCLEQYQDPRVLACLHTYCRHCLESLVEHSQERTVSCPQCREKIVISVEEVKDLKVDFMLNDMIEKMSLDQENKVDISITCETCQSDVATGRCDDCCEFMCEFCITSHRRLLRTNQHKIIGLKEATSKGKSSCKSHYCPRHKGERLTLLCDTCDELICQDCAITTHQYHKINFTSNIIDREKDEIKAKVEEVKSKQTDSSQLHDKVVNEKARIEAQKNSLTSEIDDFINAQISALEKVRSNLKDEVISDYEKRNKQLDCYEDFLSIFIANCNSCVKFAERVCQAGPGNEVEVLSLKREIMPRLSHLADTTMQDVLFEKVIVTFNVDEDFWKSVTEKASFERVTVDPQQCVVTMGTGAEPGIIYSTFAKQRIHFSVAVNDSEKQRYDAPVRVEAYVQKEDFDLFTSSDSPGPVIPLNVVMQFYDDGYGYEFTYTPPDEGCYQLSVTVNGEHVRGSPFQLSVRSKFDLVKMFKEPANKPLKLKLNGSHVALRVQFLKASLELELGVKRESNKGEQIWGCKSHSAVTFDQNNDWRYKKSWGGVFGMYLSRDNWLKARMIICDEGTDERNIFKEILYPVYLHTRGKWSPQFEKEEEQRNSEL
ncbi:tripartite motif-containing protein 45 isoform X3 [Nematostella vectensis]|uniref:tripartite motif-containing protein 45 isoform X1 n=1 Tax=Nematostella vectensis TaxID=45351 RepID=UPI0020771F40|nr:tripartite motif-containing protein 45 isoform X1 [Nematostella vectensis]XP_048590261.1 tripartite motif-containing protein 45 isoform X3 [Nematostella vectensis]